MIASQKLADAIAILFPVMKKSEGLLRDVWKYSIIVPVPAIIFIPENQLVYACRRDDFRH